jgi:hypothetical protein
MTRGFSLSASTTPPLVFQCQSEVALYLYTYISSNLIVSLCIICQQRNFSIQFFIYCYFVYFQIIFTWWTLHTNVTRAFYPHTATSATICKTFAMVCPVQRMQWNCLIIRTHRYDQPWKERLEYGKPDFISLIRCLRTRLRASNYLWWHVAWCITSFAKIAMRLIHYLVLP